jgi:hypothetical protein
MTSLEAYQSLLEKVNRNDTNSNIHVPRGKFVNIFNQQAKVWLEDILSNNKSSIKLDELENLLEDDVELVYIDKKRDHARFTLPSNFQEVSSAYCLATKGECIDRPLVVWTMKSQDKNVLLKDENHNPSFEYEETLSLINNGKVNVYFTDFSVTDYFLTYYREPKKIDLAGYIKVDGTQSTDINPDLTDRQIDEVLDYCTKEIMRTNQDVQGFQLAQQKLQ